MIIGIDGRCAAGKTTLAATLATRLGERAQVIHMDDFFLRPEQRTEARLAEPGGNVDRERVLAEALEPLSNGQSCAYRPWDCRALAFGEPIALDPTTPLTIVEGSYALHPDLRGHYDLTLFVDIDPDEQRRRLEARNPRMLQRFIDEWIPLEERYFDAFDVRAAADIVLTLGGEILRLRPSASTQDDN